MPDQIPGQLNMFTGEVDQAPPAQRHSDTSVEAAVAMAPKAKGLRQLVLDTLRENGPLTDGQISTLTGLAENTCRPRRIELTRNGQVRAVGKRKTHSGRSATVWAATPGSEAAL